MPPLFPYTDDDLKLLALCAWKEARGEGAYGMQAVMWVCCNRIGAKDFPSTLHDVIYQRNAFSSMSRVSDPQYSLQPGIDYHGGLIEDANYQAALLVAGQVLEGVLADITNGARYYWNPAASDPNGWFARDIAERPDLHPQRATIGHHVFYA